VIRKLEEVINKDTDKEAQVPASVFIIADRQNIVLSIRQLITRTKMPSVKI